MKSKGISSSSAPKPTMSSLFINDQSENQPKAKKVGLFNDEKEVQKPKSVPATVNKSNPWNIDPFIPHYNKPLTSGMFAMNDEVAKVDVGRTPPQRHSPLSKCYKKASLLVIVT